MNDEKSRKTLNDVYDFAVETKQNSLSSMEFFLASFGAYE